MNSTRLAIACTSCRMCVERRIETLKALISPNLLHDEIPLSSQASETVNLGRKKAIDSLNGKDDRLLLIIGPCSIHDPKSALEYASKLKNEAKKYDTTLNIVMRVYFEKPRTTIGWKGLINDPDLDNSFQINKGLRIARELLLKINELGLPTGTEFLDTIIPQYISDLIAWAAIGARTTESQIHRELASGLSMPVGFKNGTGGSIQIALDAIAAAANRHHFLGVTKEAVAAIVATHGNPNCHIILRGSKSGPNYDEKSIASTTELLTKNGLNPRLMIDCSHGNSGKDHLQQKVVLEDIARQVGDGNQDIFGVMIESHLVAGTQALDKKKLEYGKSVTDACIGWEDTETVLKLLSESVISRRKSK
jgi:3-deoxy-7-phosphoheptulonate synthase